MPCGNPLAFAASHRYNQPAFWEYPPARVWVKSTEFESYEFRCLRVIKKIPNYGATYEGSPRAVGNGGSFVGLFLWSPVNQKASAEHGQRNTPECAPVNCPLSRHETQLGAFDFPACISRSMFRVLPEGLGPTFICKGLREVV